MSRNTVKEEYCPVARSVDLLGDRWSLLIVRNAFDGMTRFGDFQRSLGVARNILSDRLRKLVEAEILTLQGASDGTAYQEYVLTDKGERLFPVIVALRQWGEQNLFAQGERHSLLVDRRTGRPVPLWRQQRMTALRCCRWIRKCRRSNESLRLITAYRLLNRPGDDLRLAHHRHVACRHLGGFRMDRLRHRPFKIGVDHSVILADHIPARFIMPRRVGDLFTKRLGLNWPLRGCNGVFECLASRQARSPF